MRFIQISQEADAEQARADSLLARLEQEREAHNQQFQDLERRLDRYSQRTHDTNVEIRGLQQSVQHMQRTDATNEANYADLAR
eukprot:2196749-Pyramimonas_sp.AAC.1